jgi:hypothetical protein
MKRFACGLILWAILCSQAHVFADGARFYVSPSGNDANPGTLERPWRTIGKAAASLAAGDTVLVRAGTYRERVLPQNSGRPDAYISFTAYPDEQPLLDGKGIAVPKDEGLFTLTDLSYVRVSGFRIVNSKEAGILADRSAHIEIRGNRTLRTGCSGIGIWNCREIIVGGNEVELSCAGGWQEAISIGNTAGFVVRGNTVHNGPPEYRKEGICAKDGSSGGRISENTVYEVRGAGIYVDAWDKHTFDIQVFRNAVHDVRKGNGVALASEMGGLLERIRIYNNLSWDNDYCGIAVTSNGDSAVHPIRGVWILNNTLWRNGRDPWGGGIVIDNPAAESLVIRNNLCSRNLTFEIAAAGHPAAVIDHNLLDGAHDDPDERPGTATVRSEPRFADASRADFRLQPGSPAMDAGSALDAPAEDFAGNPRPRGVGIDIGAFER